MTQEILKQLADAVIVGSEEDAVAAANAALAAAVDPTEAIISGLAGGMDVVGQYYERQKYFLTEVVMASEALNAGVAVLKPHIKVEAESKGRVVLGTVLGDTHDIGKRIVAIMLGAAGYDIFDAGRDAPPEAFIELVVENKADVLGLSALMTTSMVNMRAVIERLRQESIRDDVKVIVGGAPISKRFASEIGADAYAANAHAAISVVDELVAGARAEAVI